MRLTVRHANEVDRKITTEAEITTEASETSSTVYCGHFHSEFAGTCASRSTSAMGNCVGGGPNPKILAVHSHRGM